VWRHFQERRGHRGSGSTCGSWWRRPVGLPLEEDNQVADRVGPPVSEGRRRGRLGRKGEEERWAVTGPEGGGREVGHGWARNQKWSDSRNKIISNFIWNLDFGQTLEICTRRF
jgi:hypothetical protein